MFGTPLLNYKHEKREPITFSIAYPLKRRTVLGTPWLRYATW